jgi:hypothetical protein
MIFRVVSNYIESMVIKNKYKIGFIKNEYYLVFRSYLLDKLAQFNSF